MASFSRSQASFRPEPIQLTGGPPSNAGAAAGNVNLGNTLWFTTKERSTL